MADTELSPEREILSPAHRAAIARVDSACRMRPLGMPTHTGPLSTIYDILARTPDEGSDIPDAMDAAMQSFVLLSHQRRLLAITLARALPEIDRLARENAELRAAVVSAVESIDMAFAEIGTPHRSHPLACAFEKLLSVSPRKTALTSGPSNAK